MDPFTQGALGATFAQLRPLTNHYKRGLLVGAFAGMAPDLDVFIRSANDPLLHLQYHRHFTHALVFIPFGALLCALFFWSVFEWSKRQRHAGQSMNFKFYYAWCLLGYATHGVLDALTSYGTQLFWPFTDYRVALDVISVIDPLFTLPGLACIAVAAVYQRSRWLWLAVAWWATYLSAGALQHQRAKDLALDYAHSRGHFPQSITAKPSFANIIVWKSIYTWEGRFYVDAVKPGLLKRSVWPGESIAQFDRQRDAPWLRRDSLQEQDIARFAWFSDQYIAISPNHENRIADIRYSLIPNQINPLWSIELFPEGPSDRRVAYRTERTGSRSAARALWHMITDEGPVQM